MFCCLFPSNANQRNRNNDVGFQQVEARGLESGYNMHDRPPQQNENQQTGFRKEARHIADEQNQGRAVPLMKKSTPPMSLPIHKKSFLNESDFIDPHAGEECDICNSRAKTHFALPCGHSACLVCWTRWLFSDNMVIQNTNITSLDQLKKLKVKFRPEMKCYVCQKPVKDLKRFSYSEVTKQTYEDQDDSKIKALKGKRSRRTVTSKKTLRELQIQLDDDLEAVVHAVLEVKDELLNNIVSKFKEIYSHVKELPPSTKYDDATAVVLTVECAATNNTFLSLNELINNSRTASLWDKMVEAVTTFNQTLLQIDALLEKGNFNLQGNIENNSVNTSLMDDSSPETSDAMAIRELDSTLKLAVSKTSIIAQWDKVSGFIATISINGTLIPSILRCFQRGGYEGQLDEANIAEILTITDVKCSQMAMQIEDVLQNTLPIVALKITSLMDLL